MPELPRQSAQPLTAAQVDEWIYTVTGRHSELYLQLLEPANTDRELVFLGMSRLLQEAIEEVRVMGANLRENSEVLRQRSSELLEHSNQLLKGYVSQPEQ